MPLLSCQNFVLFASTKFFKEPPFGFLSSTAIFALLPLAILGMSPTLTARRTGPVCVSTAISVLAAHTTHRTAFFWLHVSLSPLQRFR